MLLNLQVVEKMIWWALTRHGLERSEAAAQLLEEMAREIRVATSSQ